MSGPFTDELSEQILEQRIGRLHLKQRLGIESDREARIFGQGLNFFHIENWYSIHSVIRNTLRLSFLHGRGKRNARWIELVHNHVTIPRLPKPFDGYRILHLSDLHLDMRRDMTDVLSGCVRDLDYDACVLTGDFRAQTFGPFAGTLRAMEQVRAHLKDPLYAVLGNHDTIRMLPGLEAAGIRVLLNESIVVERGDARLHIVGVDDPHYYRADNLEKATLEVPFDAASILLAHSPEIYQHAAHAGIDLLLCGHTHGGQICLPGGFPLTYNANCPRRLCSGAWRYHNMSGYTSRGSGAAVVDVRFNCRPEVTLHHLHGE